MPSEVTQWHCPLFASNLVPDVDFSSLCDAGNCKKRPLEANATRKRAYNWLFWVSFPWQQKRPYSFSTSYPNVQDAQEQVYQCKKFSERTLSFHFVQLI